MASGRGDTAPYPLGNRGVTREGDGEGVRGRVRKTPSRLDPVHRIHRNPISLANKVSHMSVSQHTAYRIFFHGHHEGNAGHKGEVNGVGGVGE